MLKNWIAEHKYSYVMLYYIVYLVVFFTLDFTMQPKYIIDCKWDDYIPFNEYFLIPYSLWFLFFVGVPALYMVLDKYDFQQLWFCMFTGTVICFICYIVVPNGINLRVDVPDRNIFCFLLNHFLWKVDAAVNVCPSLHVSTSVAMALITFKSHWFAEKKKYFIEKGLSSKAVGITLLKWAIILMMILICISTMFVKQHSVVDVICGTLVSVVLYFFTYHTNWRRIFNHGKLKVLL
ncbi:MAG: phosphatase PAP2 family protein [Eubacterium sp.]|nr:phosphatase PAP2 family protein [Eubacterium sp.]